MKARNRASAAVTRRSASRRSETSRNTSTAPRTLPSPPRIVAAVSSMGRRVPSRASSDEWPARPLRPQARKVRSAESDAAPVFSSPSTWKTSVSLPARGLVFGPAGERLGHGVERDDATAVVGHDHRVADAPQRRPQAFGLPVGLGGVVLGPQPGAVHRPDEVADQHAAGREEANANRESMIGGPIHLRHDKDRGHRPRARRKETGAVPAEPGTEEDRQIQQGRCRHAQARDERRGDRQGHRNQGEAVADQGCSA